MNQTDTQPPLGYFDSSALVKRYMVETGASWVQAWCNNTAAVVALAEIGLVEIAAAFAGKYRGNFITQTQYNDARADLLLDAQSEFVLVPINRLIIDEAIELTARHRLRGYDAVHLACALQLQQTLDAHNLPSLLFISADKDLLAAASAEGLPTDNPNDYP